MALVAEKTGGMEYSTSANGEIATDFESDSNGGSPAEPALSGCLTDSRGLIQNATVPPTADRRHGPDNGGKVTRVPPPSVLENAVSDGRGVCLELLPGRAGGFRLPRRIVTRVGEDRLRILISTGSFPPDIGGPATYLNGLCGGLAKRGHQLRVVTTSDSEHPDRGTDLDCPVVRVRRTFLPLRTIALILKLIWYGRKADVLYANGVFFETAFANLFLGRPLVFKKVGDEAWERSRRRGWTQENFEDFQQRRQSNWKARFLQRLRSWSLAMADQVIVPSQFLARWSVRWGSRPQNTHVVYNAVSVPRTLASTAVDLKTSLKVVAVGRLVSWKHVDDLIRAVLEIADLGLVVVGEGPQREALEALVEELGAKDRILFTGSRRDVLSILAGCDIFALNSSYEGLPHVLIEALSLGLPVVATRVGGVPEIIEDGKNGLLIEPFSSRELSDALRRLASSKTERAFLAERARTSAGRFRFAEMINRTEELLLLAAGRACRDRD